MKKPPAMNSNLRPLNRNQNLLAQRLHDIAGDVRTLLREQSPSDVEQELIAAEQALERAAARAETEHQA